MLEKQTITIPISGSADTKSDPFLVEPPAMLTVENARYDKGGRLSKRYGYSLLGSTNATSAQVHTMFARGDALCVLSKTDGLYTYSATVNRTRKIRGVSATYFEQEPIPCEVSTFGIGFDSLTYYSADTCQTNNYTIHVWLSTTNSGTTKLPYYVIKDTLGQTVLGPHLLQASGVSDWEIIRCAAAGDRFVIVAQADTSLTHYYWTISTTATPSDPTLGTSLSTAAGQGVLDMCTNTTGSLAHVVHRAAAGNEVRVHNINSSGTVTLSTTLATYAISGKIGCAWHSTDNQLWIAHVDTTTVYASVINTTTHATVAASTNMGTSAGSITNVTVVQADDASNTAWVAFSDSGDANDRECVRFRYATNAGGVGASTIKTYAVALGSKGFALESKPWFVVTNLSGSPDPCAFLLTPGGGTDSTTYAMVTTARVLQDQVKLQPSTLSSVYVTSGRAELAMQTALGTDGGGYDNGLMGVRFTIPPVACHVHQIGDVAHIPSGSHFIYDGAWVSENTPHVAPQIQSILGSATGSLDIGAHSWIAVWEFEDAAGNLHRSQPSAAVSYTTTGTDYTVTIELLANQLTMRDTSTTQPLRIALYRTELSGTVYKLVKRVIPTASATITGDVIVTDDASDASIADNEILYTSGDVVPNDPPPPAVDSLVAKRRMFIIDANNPTQVWYSKYLADRTAPEFSASFVLTLPNGQKATALGEIDGNLIIFTEDQIFAVAGDGPLDTGAQDTFSTPTPIASPVGCVQRNSVVAGPFGLMFLGKNGIHTLTRALDVVYSGAPVEDIVSPAGVNDTIRSAVLVPTLSEVRFQLATATALVVYNYAFGTWAKWTNNNGTHAVYCNDLYTWARTSSGNVFEMFRENVGGYADPDTTGTTIATHIEMKVVTPWIKVAGVQGFQRIRRALFLGTKVAACPLNVKIGYNYSSSFDTTRSFTQAEMDALSPLQFGVHVPRQKCEAIRFQVDDDIPGSGTPGGGITLSAFSLELGVKRGTHKLPPAARK